METKLTTWQITLLRLGMPFTEYLLKFSVPAVFIAFIAGAFVAWSTGGSLDIIGKIALTLFFPVITLLGTLLYPLANTSKYQTYPFQQTHPMIIFPFL
jgi:hypothetical protein